MNKEKVIELAKEADVWVADQPPYQEQLECFAALVEKEASYPALGALELLLMMIQPVINISGVDPESVRMTFSKEGKEFGSVTLLDAIEKAQEIVGKRSGGGDD